MSRPEVWQSFKNVVTCRRNARNLDRLTLPQREAVQPPHPKLVCISTASSQDESIQI
jgi:hypothetical protein